MAINFDFVLVEFFFTTCVGWSQDGVDAFAWIGLSIEATGFSIPMAQGTIFCDAPSTLCKIISTCASFFGVSIAFNSLAIPQRLYKSYVTLRFFVLFMISFRSGGRFGIDGISCKALPY